MSQQGVLGNGSKVAFSATSPVSWTKVSQLMNIDKFIELVANLIDNTVMGTSNVMTQMPGMIPAPSFEFTVLADFDQATAAAQETIRQYSAGSGLSQAATVLWFRIEVPVNRAQSSFRAWEFQGTVNGFSPSVPIGDKQTVKITVVYGGSLAVYNAGASQIS